MSMLALPETECQEILSLFRQHLPHVPKAWLQELAGNYGLDAVVDIDPNDVIGILSVPGELHRIQVPLAQHEPLMVAHQRMHNEMAARLIEPVRIVASLLTIQDSSARLVDIDVLLQQVASDRSGDEKKGWAWYVHKPNLTSRALTWILIC
jgi:hypothetical protein